MFLLILPHPWGKKRKSHCGNIPKEFSPAVFIRNNVGSLSPATASIAVDIIKSLYLWILNVLNLPNKTRHVYKDLSICSLECETSLSFQALLNCLLQLLVDTILVSQDVSAVFGNLHWDIWRNHQPQVIAIFSRLCRVCCTIASLSWGRPSLWVLWTRLYPWPWIFGLILSTLNIFFFLVQVPEQGLSRTWDNNISFEYHSILLCPLKLNFFLMGNDLEVFLSVSDLSNHASIPLAILLSISYVLGAGLSTRNIKIGFIMVHPLCISHL